MHEALIVNPHSREQVSEAIQQALVMPKKERVQRWESLAEGVRRDHVGRWRDAFITALRSPLPQTGSGEQSAGPAPNQASEAAA
jgi:trehalose 6-phosphate synthase